jgi:hypothetical protein
MLRLRGDTDTDTDTDTARAAQLARPGSHFDRTREINTRSISLFDALRLGGPIGIARTEREEISPTLAGLPAPICRVSPANSQYGP